jgi:glycosyltransferase involved in cell wall biosynthesis
MKKDKTLHYTFLLPSGALGGLEIQMVKRAADAIRNGDSSLFVGRPGRRAGEHARSMGVPVKTLRIRSDYIDLVAAYRLGKMMKSTASNVCIVGESNHLSLAILARKLLLPDLAIVFYHQLHGSRKKKDPFHNWVYRNLDGAVVITQKLKDSLAEKTVLPSERIKVIPYGIDVDAFDPEKHNKKENRRRFDLPEKAFLIGLVGRIEEAKGQAVAIEAFAKSGILNSALVICGSAQREGYIESLEKRTRELGIQDTVYFLKFTSEVPALMNAFDLSLLPSRGETFGLVVIEAMAAAIPVIGTDAEGVPEIIDHERNGVLVPPGDVEALANAMRNLAEDDGLRERLGRQARQDTLERYDYKTQTEKFFLFCRSVYAERQKKLGRV